VDEVYEAFIVEPIQRTSQRLWSLLDVKLVDGAVNGIAGWVGESSQDFRRVQTGNVKTYLFVLRTKGSVIFRSCCWGRYGGTARRCRKYRRPRHRWWPATDGGWLDGAGSLVEPGHWSNRVIGRTGSGKAGVLAALGARAQHAAPLPGWLRNSA
jgi:hypothetical protein